MDPSAKPFAHVPYGPHGHFLLHFYGAVYLLLRHLRNLSPADGELEQLCTNHPFLAGYLAEIRRRLPNDTSWDAGLGWWATALADWERSGAGHLPLAALIQVVGLGRGDLFALMLVGLGEEDSRFGTLFARLQLPLGSRRPSVELIDQILIGAPELASGGSRALLACGLIEVPDREAPRAEWLAHVPSLLWDAIRGLVPDQMTTWCRFTPTAALPSFELLAVSDSLRRRLSQVPALLAGGAAHAVILRGTPGSERVEALGAIAHALQVGIIEVEASEALAGGRWMLLGPLCVLLGAIPVITAELMPGERLDLPHLHAYSGAVGVSVGSQGGLAGPALALALTLEIPAPDRNQRVRVWRSILPGQSELALTTLGDRLILPAGTIRRAGAIAAAQAALDGRAVVEVGDVREACRALGQAALDTLAVRLEPAGSWRQLVVGESAGTRLYELERRCRHRERLGERLGVAFGGTHSRGVRALFVGASGTGKTLAARILAAELEMDVYRVDLASVINKYIGETEKNLHAVLARAEELDVVLLIDEGDSLLGARTTVRSSNDRYANLETNYLLQRIEHYQGIVIITTNAGENIDPAFQRRMDVVVPFAAPQAEERLQIWYLHLTADHRVSEQVLTEVAVRCGLSGGQIRGAALHAALLALDRGRPAVGDAELLEAVHAEYHKAGASCPLDTLAQHESALPDETRRFLDWLEV